MLQDINLRELSEIRGNGNDVVSVYVRGRDGRKSLADRERVIRQLLQDEPLELENFAASLATIDEVIGRQPAPEGGGVCCFASEILDFTSLHHLSIDVPDRLVVGPAPFIRPLAELQDEYETFLVVACNNDQTRLITVTNHTAEVEAAIKGGVKNHVRKGGWSQQRYERRRDGQLGQYADEVSAAIDQLVHGETIGRIVLVGSDETMRAIESRLDHRLQSRVVGRESFDLHRPDAEMIERAYERYFEDERQQEQNLWQRIKDATLSDGRGCTGPVDTLNAAKIGRVDVAVASRDLRIDATKCRHCENVAAGVTDTCPACHSHNTFRIDYLDTLARLLETSSSSLNFADPIPSLEQVGSVGALLRY